MHAELIAAHGGLNGLRDAGLLESAVAMPSSTYASAFLHRDLFEMAAAYLFHIVKNHPFVDGNKRVAAAAALTFMRANGYECTMSDDELEALVLDVVNDKVQKPAIAEILRRQSSVF